MSEPEFFREGQRTREVVLELEHCQTRVNVTLNKVLITVENWSVVLTGKNRMQEWGASSPNRAGDPIPFEEKIIIKAVKGEPIALSIKAPFTKDSNVAIMQKDLPENLVIAWHKDNGEQKQWIPKEVNKWTGRVGIEFTRTDKTVDCFTRQIEIAVFDRYDSITLDQPSEDSNNYIEARQVDDLRPAPDSAGSATRSCGVAAPASPACTARVA